MTLPHHYAARITVIAVGDTRAPQEMLFVRHGKWAWPARRFERMAFPLIAVTGRTHVEGRRFL